MDGYGYDHDHHGCIWKEGVPTRLFRNSNHSREFKSLEQWNVPHPIEMGQSVRAIALDVATMRWLNL
jgi:hypothetical protein